MSAEPSMEEILSSIKRIIAEEGDVATTPARSRRPLRAPLGLDGRAFDSDEVLELSDAVASDPRSLETDAAPTPVEPAEPAADLDIAAPTASAPVAPADAAPPPRGEPLLSVRAAEATRGPLDALSRIVVKPEVAGADTLEALVREMLRPMLREWLDARLPELVEQMVSREIARITGHR